MPLAGHARRLTRCLTPPHARRLSERLRKEAGDLLATGEGYFSPQLSFLDGDGGALLLQVDPGPQATIGSVRIELRGALADERRRQLTDGWALPSGAAFRQAAWDDANRRCCANCWRSIMPARGCCRAVPTLRSIKRVNLQLIYDAGPRCRYGRLRVTGLARYPVSLVERLAEKLRAGAPYRQDDLLAAQAALQGRSAYFASASVELAPVASDAAAVDATAEATAPVLIGVRERAQFRVALGAGVSSNTGARVEANFTTAIF